MPTDDESKRRVSLLAKGLIALAVLMVTAGTLYSRWAKQRDRDHALDDIAIGLDNTTLEFEHCITATTDSSAYGRSMFEQLRTRDFESDYEPALETCAANYNRQLEGLSRQVDTFPLRDPSWFDAHQPTLGWLCGVLEKNREYRDDFLSELELRRDALPAFDCEAPEVEARPLESSRHMRDEWRVQELRSGELLITDGRRDDTRYARVEHDGTMTWFVPPVQLEPSPVIPLQLAAKQPFVLSTDPEAPSKLMLGTWLGPSDDPEQFQQRGLDIGMPEFVLTSSERWLFVDDRYDSLDLQISDDEGTSFTSTRVPFPRQFEVGLSASYWGYVEGKRIVLLIAHELAAGENTPVQPSLLFVVRVDEAGAVSTSSIDYEHVNNSIDLYACATPTGAFASIGEQLLIHVGDTPTLVRDFAPAESQTLACQDERALVIVRDDVGLQRFVCSDQDCGDAALLTRQAKVGVALRTTPTGVRAVLLGGQENHLYIVDEPLGGPLERIEQLVRGDKLESGQLDSSDLPVFVDGMLHAGAVRAEEFYMKAPADE